MRAPNIVFIVADQFRFDALGCLDPRIKTPNLDRLAASGMRFERTFAPTPVCLPCRASMVTGQYSSTHGACHNFARLPEDYDNLLGTVFSQRGYYTHFVGKSHLAPCHDPLSQEAAPHIHNREYYRRWHGPWYGFQRADIAIGHTAEAHACGMHYGVWLEDQGVDTDRYFGHHAYTAYGAWDLPEEYHNSKWTADATIQGLDRAAELGQPYFGWVNFQDPHNPCVVPEPWASMYDPAQIPQHGFKDGEPACFDDKPPFYKELLEQPGDYACQPSDPALTNCGNVCHLDWDQDQVQANAAAYYGMISLLDHHVGRILDHLEATGQRDNTLIVFTADHGEILGDHGLWFKSMVAYDESIRVPMIVSYPGRVPAGTVQPAFQNLIDLFPTFCHYAGIPAPWRCEGVDQHTSWEDPATAVRDHTIVEERPTSDRFAQRIIITDDYKMALYAERDFGELYRLPDDPHHTCNLWDDSDHAAIRQRLTARILSDELLRREPHPTFQVAEDYRVH